MSKLTSDKAHRRDILNEVYAERNAQDAKFGLQDIPDGTNEVFTVAADRARTLCQQAFDEGRGTYRYILEEEFWEAMAETDPDKLRAELLQVAAVCVKWCEVLDQRSERQRETGAA